MSLAEIKAAIEAGQRVFWCNPGYEVIKDKLGQYLIKCRMNSSCMGLTHLDGITLNGDEDEFFIGSIG